MQSRVSLVQVTFVIHIGSFYRFTIATMICKVARRLRFPLVVQFLAYRPSLLASDGQTCIHSRRWVFTSQCWVLAEVSNVEVSNRSFGKVCALDIGSLKTCSGQDSVDEKCSSKRGALKIGSVDNGVGEVGAIKVAVCSSKIMLNK